MLKFASPADFIWSPANTPNPPLYVGMLDDIPISAEKYAISNCSFMLCLPLQ